MTVFSRSLNGIFNSICYASGAPTAGENIYADYKGWHPSWARVRDGTQPCASIAAALRHRAC